MRLLLVEDEPEMSAVLAGALTRHNCVVDHVEKLAAARQILCGTEYDAILLDWSLPDGEGVELIGIVRAGSAPSTPIILLTARHSLDDRVRGLDHGADDYMVKPFEVAELLARLRALRRRPAVAAGAQLEVGRVILDLATGEATVAADRLALPRRERAVLACLMRRAGRTVLRESLEAAVFGLDDEISSNSLDAHVSRLRRKLNSVDAKVEIHSIRGVGYLLRSDASE